jgi:hypothetical protein
MMMASPQDGESDMQFTRREALGALTIATGSALSTSASAWEGPLMDLVQGSEDFATASDAYVYG